LFYPALIDRSFLVVRQTMTLPFTLDNETALITGGGSGLGLGIAQCFCQAGAKVIIVGRRRDVLEAACAQLGERAACVAMDITDFEAAGAGFETIVSRHGQPTILVNNAGTHLKKPAIDTRPDEFEAVLRTHLTAAHNLTRLALPGMLARRHGNLLFIASMASFIGVPMIIAYAAAKSACLGMVRTLAAEVSGRGVRVNAIAPGWIHSPMLEKALDGDPDRRAKILSRTPMEGFGSPEDIGWAAVYLCSPAAKFVTGAVLPVDGGASIGF
jgi:gluconate 5-dehydrogenase